MQEIKVKGHSVQKLEWKQVDGQTNEQTNGGNCIISSLYLPCERGW